jgi:chromosome segregation ATPase
MDPRPRQPTEGLPPPAADLDNTDELPALDVKAFEASERSRLADTWVQPALTGEPPGDARADATVSEDPLQAAVANLRMAEELLASRGARLGEIERALAEAHAARVATERRVERLTEELAAARAATEQKEREHAAGQSEARSAAERLESRHAEELAEARAQLERREAELALELTRARAAAGDQASSLAAELAQMRSAALQREAEQARQLSDEKLAGEVRLLAEREAATEARRSHDQESQQALAARDRAHALLQTELQELRDRLAATLESSQSAERRRALFEGLLSELHDELENHASGRAQLTRDLASRDTRTAALESDLSQRAARIATLESQLAGLNSTLGLRDTELTTLRATQASLNTALEGARAATSGVTTRAAEYESALGEARTRSATLEAELGAERKRGAEREQELAKVRADMEEWAGALRTAQLERSGHVASIGAGEARVKQLEERVAEQVDMLRTLQSTSEAALARTQELEADLRAAEDTIGRLESQLRGRNARVSELEKANQQWRHTLEESRSAHVDTDTHLALRDAGLSEEGAGREPPPDGAARLLIQSDGGREVVHVLGRKTTIGRTPENDVQIDAKYISRHHAVILVGPAHTIIEDLNSTNGVMVNGRRITRQILKDGDQVSIGRSEYRFGVRRTSDKH